MLKAVDNQSDDCTQKMLEPDTLVAPSNLRNSLSYILERKTGNLIVVLNYIEGRIRRHGPLASYIYYRQEIKNIKSTKIHLT